MPTRHCWHDKDNFLVKQNCKTSRANYSLPYSLTAAHVQQVPGATQEIIKQHQPTMAEATETATLNKQNNGKNDNEDDMSVNTTVQENRTEEDRELREYTVKFQFRPSQQERMFTARTHFAILKAIQHVYLESKIFDNNVKILSKFPSIKSYQTYKKHFVFTTV